MEGQQAEGVYMEEIIEQIGGSEYLKKLPEKLSGFVLTHQYSRDDQVYKIFSYHNQQQRRSFSVIYDNATKEYIARVTVGLVEFCDIAYIVADLAALEKVLAGHLENTLSQLGCFDIKNLDLIFREKKIAEWAYAAQLPVQAAGFELFIRPEQPLKIINGSYIILDYSDFSSDSNLIIYYNIYRDEFFGELRIKKTPQMAAVFETKLLSELEEKLSLYLVSTLEDMRKQI